MDSHLRIKGKNIFGFFGAVMALSFFGGAPDSYGMELHWSGQFWSEFHFLNNYTLDGNADGALDVTRLTGPGGEPLGYYIPGGGKSSATFETLFLRLKPRLVVNDNITIKSEWWVGDPVFGLFGSAVPYPVEQRQFYSNLSRGANISAQRFWVELLSDFGTIQVGRAPLQWGLGVVWNSGDEMWSRQMSTGDTIRLVSKFGAFSFVPAFILHSTGNSLGGACIFAGGVCTPTSGGASVADYSLALKYENLEEDLEGGVNFIRRLAAAGQGPAPGSGPALAYQGAPVGYGFNIWDIYGRKRLGAFSFGAEVPITSGQLGGLDYSTVALATDIQWKITDSWETQLRAGHAPGQPNSVTANPERFDAFFFHPNYHLGLVMFNYQLVNFSGNSGPNTLNNPSAEPENLRSAFDNPIVNANYLSFGGTFKTQKWSFNTGLIHARAVETAKAGEFFFNTWQRKMSSTAAVKDQGTSLGWEVDAGAAFQWDDYFQFRLDMGLFFPGEFYEFSNAPSGVDNVTDPVFATRAAIGISF